MSLSANSKRWVKKSLLSVGALRTAREFARTAIAILMYHSVTDEPERNADTLGNIGHRTDVFRRQMELIAKDYHPVSLPDVLLFLEGKGKLPRTPVAVTFDDGYADNAETAAPVLNGFGIPAAFYLTVHCIDTAKPPWPAALRHAFFTTRKPSWSDAMGRLWPVEDGAEREAAFLEACRGCASTIGAAQAEFVAGIERDLDTEPLSSDGNLMMTWRQARVLAGQGHIVGSHTLSHPNLARVKHEEVCLELARSKERLEEQLGQPVLHFAYPNATMEKHWTQETVAMSRQAGYRSAVVIDSGPVRENDDPLSLRRVPAPHDMDEFRWSLECTFLGRSM